MSTAPRDEGSWSVNQRAARAVAIHGGGSPADRRHLLELLGLIEPGGRRVLPDDTRPLRLSFDSGTIAPSSSPGVAQRSGRSALRPALQAVPAADGASAARPTKTPTKKKAASPAPPATPGTATPAALIGTDLDVWLAEAQRSGRRDVRRACAVATNALMALRIALDDLARAERAHTRRTAR